MDAADIVIGRVTIVIDYALAPGTAKDRIGSAGKNDRIFDRDDALVIVAIQSPSLELPSAEAAFMHHQVEGVLVVVAFLTDGAQLRPEFIECEQAGIFRARGLYRSNCHPSSATSHPASRTCRYSGPASFSMGFVLLMCK